MRATGLFLLTVLLLAGCGGGDAPRAVHAPLCYPPYGYSPKPRAGACLSPDHAWSVRVRYGPRRLVLTRIATGAHSVVYNSHNACCTDLAWVPPHRLFFADDYTVSMLDPQSRKVTFLAGWDDFYVSPDGRWLAGYATSPPGFPEVVGVISVATGKCMVVPGNNNYIGSEFGLYPITPKTGFSPSGDDVVVATPDRGVEYRISALSQRCAAGVTRKP